MSLNKSLKPGSAKSQSKFILIHGQTKEEEPIRWQWLTQRFKRQQENAKIDLLMPRLSYSEKKSILSGLQKKERAVSSFKIRDGFSRKQKVRILSTATTTNKPERRSLQPFIYINSNEEQLSIPNINLQALKQELVDRMVEARLNGRAIITILSAKRMGLRFKLFHTFIEYCTCNKVSHGHDLKTLTEQVKQKIKQFSKIQRQLYYFYVDGKPLHSYADILKSNPSVLLVDCVPKLNFSKEMFARIHQQAQKIQAIFQASKSLKQGTPKKDKNEVDEDDDEQQIYDWQRIQNVKEYVDKVSQNPARNMLYPISQRKDQLTNWYNQRYRQDEASQIPNPKQTNRNPLFESKSHFPGEIVNKKLLSVASEKIQCLQSTNNRHKFIPARLDLMMELVKRQNVAGKPNQQTKAKGTKAIDTAISKKDLLHYLDKKNTLLSAQNIPYLIQKYGLNRFQVYNLYNLYKSFEKVSLLRHSESSVIHQVMEKGIDRQTFQTGLKGLDMNPGDQLIKNICYFGDFITWQQFIKIISISLRKTPEQKLTAILKGISSTQDGFLTRYQISMMIGNSLQKLFDKQENQLKEYFTDMAMKEFDMKAQGKVYVQTLKEKVLGNGSGNLTMVSFLILNT